MHLWASTQPPLRALLFSSFWSADGQFPVLRRL